MDEGVWLEILCKYDTEARGLRTGQQGKLPGKIGGGSERLNRVRVRF